jgi:hypothetical protein
MGSDSCYKVGLTKNPLEMRIKGLATGSPVKPTPYRQVETENPSRLEKYIHHLLDAKRGNNGEFFYVTQQELDDAVDKADAFMKQCDQVLPKAKTLCRKKPNDTMEEPSGEILEIYRQLREAVSKEFLLKQHIEFLESKIKVAIGESGGMRSMATWKWEICRKFVEKLFQEEHKELYEQYKRERGGRKFRLLRELDLTNCTSAAGTGALSAGSLR